MCVGLNHQTDTTMKNTEKIQVELVGENNLKNTIEKRLKKSVMFFSDSDGANLLFTATVNGCSVARVYKSFDEHYNAITIIRYNNEAL